MTGAEKEQCLRDENSKTEGSSDSAGAARVGNPDDTYSRNQSKRCNTMTGAEKDQCLRDEDSKTDSSAGSITESSR